MSEHPDAAVPPEWMNLPEARRWIALRFPQRAGELQDALLEALRGDFPHRIAGWDAARRQWPFRCNPFPPNHDEPRVLAGMRETPKGRVVVTDWALCKVDWAAGTVRNYEDHRSPIEVCWDDVRHLARTGGIPADEWRAGAEPSVQAAQVAIPQQASARKSRGIFPATPSLPASPTVHVAAPLPVEGGQDPLAAREPKGSPKRAYSRLALIAWFVHRTATWETENPGKPPPNRPEDLAAAEAYFGRRLPPDEFRQVRQEKTPDAWRKRGPRGPRRRRSADQ